MTPFLHKLYKLAKSNTRTERARKAAELLIPTFEDSLCFECTDVMPLVAETMKALLDTGSVDIAKDPILNHGGLFIMPHVTTWLEWSTPEGRVGAVLCQEDDGSISIGILHEANLSDFYTAVIEFQSDDYMKIICSIKDNETRERAQLAGVLAEITATLMIIINAPYGIEQEIKPPHKVWAKEAAQHGLKLKATRRIYLNKTKAPPAEYAKGIGQKTGFHKAFHFVRRHLRHFQNGKHTFVKAHWRGDPRLGIRKMPEYKVRP